MQFSNLFTQTENVNSKKKCFIISEVAQAHDGSLGMAHAFIDAIARAGADAVKFQTHIATAESTPSEPWRVKFSHQDQTRYDYWSRMEFTEEQWQGLKAHAEEKELFFLSSPFSLEAVDLLEKVGVAAWKIASGEVNNGLLFDRIARTQLPVLLSTGMSSLEEIDTTVATIREKGLQLAILQCTSMYPTPPEKVGINLIHYFQERYGCPVGLSDHSGTIYPTLAAATLGAKIIEVHVTFSHEMFGPDVPASITTTELAQMVSGVRFIEAMLANPVNKDEVAEELVTMRSLFNKSVVLRSDMPADTLLQQVHLTVKKPGTGIPAARIADVIGRRLARTVQADELFGFNDLQ